MKIFRFNRKMRFLVIILFVLTVFISLAYATLTKTLTIKFNSITQQALIWNVGFKTGTVTATASGSSSTGRSCGSATATATTVTVANTSLSKPGDKCIWALQVQNSGTIDANLSAIAATSPTGTNVTCTVASAKNKITCGNIIYSLTTNSDGSTLLTTNTTVSKRTNSTTPGTLDVYLVAEYDSSVTTLNLASDIVQSSAQFSLTFSQK